MNFLGKRTILNYFFIFLGLLVIVFGYIRLYLGVDFLDEAWYVSTIQNFSLGASPFLNEYRLQQIPFILLAPIYKIFVINFSFPAIIFVRHIYFLMVFLCFFIIFNFLKFLISKPLSFAISSLLFVDVFAIPSVSYNSIGRLFFTMGVVLLSGIFFNKNKKNIYIKSFFSALFLVICSISYLSLIFAVILFFILMMVFVKKNKENLFPVFLTMVIFGLICVIFLFYIWPVRDFIIVDLNIMNLSIDHSFNLIDKFGRILNILKLFIQQLVILLVLFFLKKKFSIKNNSLWFLVSLILVSFFSILKYESVSIVHAKFVSLFSFAGLTVYFYLSKKILNKYFLLFIILVSLVISGFITALTSANGYTNICVGLSPAVLFSMVVFFEKFKYMKYGNYYFLIFYFFIICFYIYTLFGSIYGEEKIFSLSERIDSGPYRYIYTTLEKKEFINDFSKSLAEINYNGKKSILCYYNFPACYLFGHYRMDFYSTWIINWWMTSKSFDKLLCIVKNDLKLINFPDIVVRYKYNDKSYIGVTSDIYPDQNYDPIGEMFKIKEYNPIIKKNDYEILINQD